MFWTYIDNIQCVGHQPNHLGSDILAYGMLFRKVHSYHKDCGWCKDQGTDFLCKLYYPDSQCHVDIHLFELQKKYLSFYKIIIFLI